MFTLVRHDLEFILKQILISEQHVAGADLAALVGNPLNPYGLRTVDGTYNNLLPGREEYGAADNIMPRLLDPVMLAAYTAPTGLVVDTAPRTISNLIVDQSSSNPAALLAALQVAGSNDLVGHANSLRTAEALMKSTETAATSAESASLSAQQAWQALQNDAEASAEDLAAAQQAWDLASGQASAARAAADSAAQAFNSLTETLGVTYDNGTWVVPNLAPDDGISASFNSWMTLFGQFFDHGLDLVSKGGSGTVFIPLMPDDPLYVPGSPTNFMVLTRATNQPGEDGILGTADDVREHKNTTTSWVDQNQTYTSHPSHQVFLREYEMVDGKPMATGRLLDGEHGGPPTWADVKAQAREMLGIDLSDIDVGNVPLLATDPYGEFLRGPNGFAQLVTPTGLVEGNPDDPVSTVGSLRTAHAFLDDIAHAAVPVLSNGVPNPALYDEQLLDKHFITGDGRGNENIGLTAVHTIFHAEHNRLVDHIKQVILESNDPEFIAQWLKAGVNTADGIQPGEWDGERLFQAARFTTEMEYQHLVFEEFGRKVQPDIDVFVFEPSIDIDPQIFAEFAHVVYRFGHSMLNETVDRIGMDMSENDIGLIEAFLNPVAFTESGIDAHEAAGAIIRGMTRQTGNEIDEFITGALRNNLVGLPLDLATVNLARARDTGVPSLNEARRQFFEATQDTQLKPYESWSDFAQNIKNPASIINFIAAYGTHASLSSAITLEAKRAAATALVMGGEGAPSDRLAFLNSTGSWAGVETGLNKVDFWIGGLAEQKMSFGGMLGSTFSFVFELQMENLQDSDRFYYLSRTQGLNLLNQLEANSFAELVMRNTTLGQPGSSHLPGDLFSSPDHILEMNEQVQIGDDPEWDNPVLQAMSPMVVREDSDGDGDWDKLAYHGVDHVVLGGTEEDDILIAGEGDDTVWGDGGDDIIEGGYGVDRLHGGAGNDIITNSGTDIGEVDMIHGGTGDDVIHGGSGLALIFGEEGSDFVITGPDGKEVFGGLGNDFIMGGDGGDFLLGNEGNDWIEGGGRFDTLAGENSELFFNSTIIGHDVLNGGSNDTDYDGESGDDIMFQSEGIQRNNGMAGFDWAIHKGSHMAANTDLGIPIFTNQEDFILRDRFDLVEGVSGWIYDDILTGREVVVGARDGADGDGGGAAIPGVDSPLASVSNALLAGHVDLINGYRELLTHLQWDESNPEAVVLETDDATDILLGGDGSDRMEGKAGNDIIDGDRWLNVRISIRDRENHDIEIGSAENMAAIQDAIFKREILPSQLEIVREILSASSVGSVDTAVFSDELGNYDITFNEDGSITVSHARGTQSDGTDTLRNIERMQFSDVAWELDGTPRGLPTLNFTRMTEGQSVSANVSTILDPDVIVPDSFYYQWQAAGSDGLFYDIEGATGASFAPGQDQVGKQLRVMVLYSDQRGFNTVLESLAGPVVGDLLIGSDGANVLAGTAVQDRIEGRGGNDSLYGHEGDDELLGEAGNDTLNGGAGADVMAGGVGNDTYVVDNAQDQVAELAGEGTDMINTALNTWSLGDFIENLRSTGSGDFVGNGNSTANTLWGGSGNDQLFGNASGDRLLGNEGNDLLDGGTGHDTMAGGAGDDIYMVDTSGDQVQELAGEGTDLVRATVASHTLADHVENLAFIGVGNFSGTGNALANHISGGSGNDTLNGMGGADTMEGGAGNDVYVVDDANDVVIEQAGNGSDQIQTALASWTLGDFIENLRYTGSGNFTGTGNSTSNTLWGGSGNDILSAGASADRLVGGAGNDWMDGGSGNDTFVFAGGFGHDTIEGFDANAVNGQDKLDIAALGINAGNFGASVNIAAAGSDTLITIGSNSITLLGIAAGEVNVSDFLLAS